MRQVQCDLSAAPVHVSGAVMRHHSVVTDAHLLLADKLARLPPSMHAAACLHAATMSMGSSNEASGNTKQTPLLLEASKAEHSALFHSIRAVLPELQSVQSFALRLNGTCWADEWCTRAAELLVETRQDLTARCVAIEAGSSKPTGQPLVEGRSCAPQEPTALELLLQLAAPTVHTLALHAVPKAVSMLCRCAVRLAGLRHLTLTHTCYIDRPGEADMAQFYCTVLQQCTALTGLRVVGVPMKHDDTVALSNAIPYMTNLRSLQLPHSPGMHNGTDSHTAMPRLVEQLGKRTTLTELDVTGVYYCVHGALLLPIPALPSLQRLRCGVHNWKGKEGDKFLRQLTELTGLSHLHLLADQLDSTWDDEPLAAVVRVITSLAKLQVLQLCAKAQAYAHTGPALCSALSTLTHLSSVQLHGLERNVMADLGQCCADLSALRSLHLVACSAAGCAVALQAFTGLHSFTCEGYAHDEGSFALFAQRDMRACISALGQHTQLTHLALRRAMVQDQQLLALACMACKCCNLVHIDLSGNDLGASEAIRLQDNSFDHSIDYLRKLVVVLAQLKNFKVLDVCRNKLNIHTDDVAFARRYASRAGRHWVFRFDKPGLLFTSREAVSEELV